jgi:hypothetical protein
MPNWCNNTVTLEHTDPAMIERAKAAFLDGKFLNEFIPVPEDLHIVAGSVGAKGSPEQNELELKEQANREKHGYATWYEFCVNEWGTKWDVGGDDGYVQDLNGGIMLTFDSAWAPPTNAYEKLVDMGFRVHATYFEGGMMFAGDWENGEDDYYELGNMSSAEIKEALPEHLDEAYGISEMKAEWEDEEAADLED